MTLPIPVASDPVESRADWLEFQALRSKERRVSLEDLVRVIRREGSVDGLEIDEDNPVDRGSSRSQQVAEDTFSELENRALACHGEYPFELEQGLLKLRDDRATAPYMLLLLLSFKEPTPGHEGTAALFELLCTHAAKQYLGGELCGAAAFRFGSPRQNPFAKLSQAIDYLCEQLCEGGGCRDSKYAKHTGDDGLDIVAWKHFPDRRSGKLIAFGQCAGGRTNWTDKLNELDGRKFAAKLFRDPVVVDPIRFFFVPRRLPSDDWEKVSIDAGVVFDRCRIASCLKGLDENLNRKCADFVKTFIKQPHGPKKIVRKRGRTRPSIRNKNAAKKVQSK
jgi:hypothetical protein